MPGGLTAKRRGQLQAAQMPYAFAFAQKNSSRETIINQPNLNGLCPYYTMFPLTFPLEQLAGMPENSWVFDPFCGRGTTAFAARLLGLPSIGTDVNPVAVAIARAKLVQVQPRSIVRLARTLLKNATPDPLPAGRFWELAYSPATLEALLKLRAGLRGVRGHAADALRGIVLGALHGPQPKTKDSYFSNQMQRTFAPKPDYAVRYWEARGMLPHDVDMLGVIRERAERFYSDLEPAPPGKVLLADARRPPVRARKFAATVTSPPYFGMDTYVSDQWLRNWFVGGEPRPLYDAGQQLSRGTRQDFTHSLGQVWWAVASRSLPNAKLAVRFGAIRSRGGDPEAIMRQSLIASRAPWEVLSVTPAGGAEIGRRQADQMGGTARKSTSIEELDFVCRLR